MTEWNAVSAFFAMGGYGGYVFGSLTICLLFVAIELLLLQRAYRQQVLHQQRLATPMASRRRAVVVHRHEDNIAAETSIPAEGEE